MDKDWEKYLPPTTCAALGLALTLGAAWVCLGLDRGAAADGVCVACLLALLALVALALLRLEGNEQRIAAACYIGEKQLNVAASEEYIEGLLQKKQRENAVKRSVYVIKDVRLFLNSVDRSMENIRRAGVDARCDKQESEDTITITIQIPKRKGFRSPDAAAENR